VTLAYPDAVDPATLRIEATHGLGRVLARDELWRYRELAAQLAVRDIKVRYRQTLLGAAWAVLQPVATMVVFSIFFGNLAGVPADDKPYALFALAALVPWTFFANSLLLGSNSLVTNAAMLRQVYFPRILIPAGVLAANLVDLGIAFVVLVVVVLAYGIVPPPVILLVPLLVILAIAAALGVSVGLAALNVRYRDVRYAVPFLTQLWLFITPVAYPSSLLDEPWRTLSALNPMVGVVEGFRWVVLGTHPPSLVILISALSAGACLIVGLAYFARVERTFADLV
jgi:lipopolysaccharide transport system permease protein